MQQTYAIITDRMLATLEAGVVPWHKPCEQGIPRNLVSGKPYRGINVFLTASAGVSSPYWLSFKQCKELKRSVKAGAKGTPVVFWKWLDVERDEGEAKQIPLLRYYTVFNLEQCTGIKTPVMTEKGPFTPIEFCEKVIGNMPQRPVMTHGEPRAYYRPLGDSVNMPRPELFDGPEEYYSTLFHELTHSTGHESRLNRHKEEHTNCLFGSPEYSKEELCAEMGAAFLCCVCGIDNRTVDK